MNTQTTTDAPSVPNVPSAPNTTSETSEAKKAYKMPASVKAKIKANNQFKKDMFTISGLYKYMQGDGAELVQDFINSTGSEFDVKRITKKALIANLTDKEKTHVDGTPKKLFSYYFLLHAVGRIVRNK